MVDFVAFLCYNVIMMNNLGSLIKEAREKMNLSVRDLAKMAEINHTDVSKLEHNKIKKPSINMLISLSKILGCNFLAAYLEDDNIYLRYKKIIELCDNLSNEQLDEIVSFIDEIKSRGAI